MRAILLAAGYGSRLRPLTDHCPKCLAPIQGVPLLGIWLERLQRAGIGPLLINTHYRAEQVREFIAGRAAQNRVTLVHEAQLAGTAGTLFNHLKFFQQQDGLLIHADNYCLADLGAFMAAHRQRPSECLLTMMVFRSTTPSCCGIVEVDFRGVVTEFHEKVANPPGNLANGAIYALSASFLKHVQCQRPLAKDFSTEVLPYYVGRIYTWETTAPLVDVGTPEGWRKANDVACREPAG